MARAQLEIEIPEGAEVVSYRLCYPIQPADKRQHIYAQIAIVIQPRWIWPPWLMAAAIAMDSDLTWWGYSIDPVLSGECQWICDFANGGGDAIELIPGLLDFTPPPCSDWTKSKRLNPNRKVTK